MALENVKQNMYTRYIPMVGYPMDHSSASYVYNWLFNRYDINAIMWPLEVEKGRLPELMAARHIMQMDKIALTMPHKADIIPLLDEVDECSRLFNSVNIVKTENGKTIGSGFDGKGCIGALKGAGVELAGATVMMCGAGSISGAIGYELSVCGVKQLNMANRSVANAEKVAEVLRAHTPMQVATYENTIENLKKIAADADVFIQCTPMGMSGFGADYEDLSFLECLPKHCTVLDVVVNPPETSVMRKAKECGLKTIMGMDMMISQMSEIFQFWYGVMPGAEEKAACKELLLKFFAAKK